MPTYTYRCENCNLEIEQVQKITDDPLITCPECTHETLKRVIQANPFLLKGSGWYKKAHKA